MSYDNSAEQTTMCVAKGRVGEVSPPVFAWVETNDGCFRCVYEDDPSRLRW